MEWTEHVLDVGKLDNWMNTPAQGRKSMAGAGDWESAHGCSSDPWDYVQSPREKEDGISLSPESCRSSQQMRGEFLLRWQVQQCSSKTRIKWYPLAWLINREVIHKLDTSCCSRAVGQARVYRGLKSAGKGKWEEGEYEHRQLIWEVWLESRKSCHCLPDQQWGWELNAGAMSDSSRGQSPEPCRRRERGSKEELTMVANAAGKQLRVMRSRKCLLWGVNVWGVDVRSENINNFSRSLPWRRREYNS